MPVYNNGGLVGYGYCIGSPEEEMLQLEVQNFMEENNLSFNKNENKFIPIAVYCNTEKKTTVVKWADGTETKVTCDDQDTFSPDAGYSECLKIKLFGNNKAKFKDFWSAVISRRVFVDGVKVKPEAYGRWEKERKAESKARKAKKPKAKK